MQFWSDLCLYITAIVPHIWSLMVTGAFLGGDRLIVRFSLKAEIWLKKMPFEKRRRLELTLLFHALFYVGFSIWREDHHEMETQLERTRADYGFYVQRHLHKNAADIVKSFVADKTILRAQVPIYLTSSTDNDSSYLMQELQTVLVDAGLNAVSTGTSPQGPGETGFVLFLIDPAKPSPAASELIELLTRLDEPPKVRLWTSAMRKGWPPTPDFYLFVTRDQPAPN